MLREAHAACNEASATGMPIDEVTELRGERARLRAVNRREFLSRTASLIACAALPSTLRPVVAHAAQKRIVIVGAGLAGIRCAHKLWIDHGLASTIYEWDNHVGGRVETVRNYFSNGQIVELHGEFISSEHSSMLALARRYDLALDNSNSYPPHTANVYWFNGGYYTQAQLNADWENFAWTLFHNSVTRAPFPTRHHHHTKSGYKWDHMSVAEWIDQNVPGGLTSALGKLFYQDAIDEFGGPPEEQSALNLIYLLGYDDSRGGQGYQPRNSPVLAGSDEKYHVTGGNDQIIQGMVNELPSCTIQLGQRLIAVKLNSDGSYTCTFQTEATMNEAVADHVVLAIPFSTLCKVDLSKANLSALKLSAIHNLRLGNNAKILLQFNSRVWNQDGFTGNTFADNGAAGAWEVTNYQPGANGILLDFPGGTQGARLAAKYGLTADQGVAPPAMVNDTLRSLDQIFPGVSAAYNGLAYYNDGNIDEHLLGAWSQYRIGQYTGFSGVEPLREGNLHFAGEQTSLAFQGFMEGAVRSGERVADEI